MTQINKLLLALIISICATTSVAQILTPIEWDTEFTITDDNTATATFKATIEDGWHLYALDLPADGPIATSVIWEELWGIEPIGEITPNHAAHREIDMLFHLELGWWTKSVTLTQKFKITTDNGRIGGRGHINFMACNDQSCLPPNKKEFTFSKNLSQVADAETKDTTKTVTFSHVSPTTISDTWQPVDIPNETESALDYSSLWYIFIGGFIGGLLALLTPCVWPMIPLTVSFFLKKSNSRGKSIIQATGYGLSIIIIYLLLGLLVTLIFGASKLNDLSTNAIFNMAFFALLVVFAISFFGAFDITLPSSWSSKINNSASETTGWLSIFFMAFTLTLVSFSCTGPIIGTLLVEAATLGDITGPAIGMFGFALALAIPFSLFAIFPSWLKEIPKSGGWLNSVKVVLGFIELALSLKFLSVADLAYGWHILDREVFLSLWIVIFALLGLYLLGKLRFSHDKEIETVGVPRFMLALVSFSFSVYMLPGLWGAPLKAISAFAPPLHTQDFNLYTEANFQEFDDYDDGLSYAKQHNLPVFIDFSGHGCVNCRKMEAAVFENTEVRANLEKNFVMVKLMVDDKQKLRTPQTVTDNGKEITLRSVGDKWSYLQRHKFGANSQPYYAIVNYKGEMLAGPYYYDEDISKFLDFLNAGINKFKKK